MSFSLIQLSALLIIAVIQWNSIIFDKIEMEWILICKILTNISIYALIFKKILFFACYSVNYQLTSSAKITMIVIRASRIHITVSIKHMTYYSILKSAKLAFVFLIQWQRRLFCIFKRWMCYFSWRSIIKWSILLWEIILFLLQ